jgi:hypothetical protein
MTSKTTKSIAARIPVDLYFQLQKEAEKNNQNMNDYLILIIEARNTKKEKSPEKVKIKLIKDKPITSAKQAKQKKIVTGTPELDFPE